MVKGVIHEPDARLWRRFGWWFQQNDFPNLGAQIHQAACMSEGNQLHVILDPFEGDTAISEWIRQINKKQLQIPWLGDLVLQISIAQKPALLKQDPAKIKERVFAKSAPQKVA